jgi:hypothetical protein
VAVTAAERHSAGPRESPVGWRRVGSVLIGLAKSPEVGRLMGGVEADFGKRSDQRNPRVRLDELQRVGTRSALRARGPTVGEALPHDRARPSIAVILRHSASLAGWIGGRRSSRGPYAAIMFRSVGNRESKWTGFRKRQAVGKRNRARRQSFPFSVKALQVSPREFAVSPIVGAV